jgi:ataxin-3
VAEGSGNVDPSGNFSIEVLRSALKVEYDLDLPNIRQESIGDFGDVTEMEGFICNKTAHWFAIRKINGRFWNLNSMEERPQIISHFKLATEIAGFQDSGCKQSEIALSRFHFVVHGCVLNNLFHTMTYTFLL